MRITRIDFEGRHEIKGQSGHWYATAQRRDGMYHSPDTILVTIIAPETPNGREHHVTMDDDDIESMAQCLAHHLEDTDNWKTVLGYIRELKRLAY